MNLRMTILLGSVAAVATLADLLEENGYDIETGEFEGYDGPAPQPVAAPAAAPAGVPSPPSASAPASTAGAKPKRETKKEKAAREAAAAQPAADVFTGGVPAAPLVTEAQLNEPVSPALAALAGGGVPQPPAAAPAAPGVPSAPAAPAASPAPSAATLVDPAAYVAPAAYTLEVLQSAMANLLANGRSASQAQQFLTQATGYKALKDLPPEWYPRAHWCLATGTIPAA